MIITRLVSGLGNQLFQYAIGKHLSIRHGVPLKLDTSFFETQTLRRFKLDNYNIVAQIASPEEINHFLFWQKDHGLPAKFYRKIQKMFPRNKRRYIKESEWWIYDPDVLNASSNVYLDGYWQHYKYFLNVYPEIFTEITLKEGADGAQVLKERILENSSSVSIHIRRGDYITDPDAYNLMGTLPLEYYASAMDFINTKLSNPFYYIFSDDLNCAKDNLNIKAPSTFVDLEGGLKDYIELDLMSKCHHNIIANSSFSWWGAFLNRNPGKIVISPATWAIDKKRNEGIHLQFPSWIKI